MCSRRVSANCGVGTYANGWRYDSPESIEYVKMYKMGLGLGGSYNTVSRLGH